MWKCMFLCTSLLFNQVKKWHNQNPFETNFKHIHHLPNSFRIKDLELLKEQLYSKLA